MDATTSAHRIIGSAFLAWLLAVGAILATDRTANLLTRTTVSNTHPIRLSQLERGLTHDTQLATRYHQWLTTNHPN